MKYDYKVSKSQGRPIRFFAELDAIMQGKGIEGGFEEDGLSRNVPDRDQVAMSMNLSKNRLLRSMTVRFLLLITTNSDGSSSPLSSPPASHAFL